MQLEPASVWSLSSMNAASGWRLESDELLTGGVENPRVPPNVGQILEGQGSSLLQAPTPSLLWMAGQSGLTLSTDGGHLWHAAWPSLERPTVELDFVDAEHGWCLVGPEVSGNGLFQTTDGGKVWNEIG